MKYETYQPHADLDSLVKCYWTLEVPPEAASEKQRIIPDGCIEMIFVLGDDIRRYTGDDTFIIQPRAMILGQISEPFFVEPTGAVHSFAVRFYPYGLFGFLAVPLVGLANRETPINDLFGEHAGTSLAKDIGAAADTKERIDIIEHFLLRRLAEDTVIDEVVRSTIDTLFLTNGSAQIKSILDGGPAQRRQLERKFVNQVGTSPKQLGKVIRMQTALKMLLNQEPTSLTEIAYESAYYDQAHFIKDFKEFTGLSPGAFLDDKHMALSSLFYSGE